MKTSIDIGKKRTREQTQETTAQAKPMFQSRPFVVQSKTAEQSQQPDLKTALQRAEQNGHRLSRKAVEKSAGVSESTKNKGGPVQLARSRSNSEPVREAEKEQLTKESFTKDFMKQSEEQATDAIRTSGERGKNLDQRTMPGRGRQKLGFHVTTRENLENILEEGLDPQKGGKDGAGSLLGGPPEFIERSKGRVHFTDNTIKSGFYAAHMFDYGVSPKTLGIRLPKKRERDSDDSNGSYRTAEKIPKRDVTDLGHDMNQEALNNYEENGWSREVMEKMRSDLKRWRMWVKEGKITKTEGEEAEDSMEMEITLRKRLVALNDETVPLGEEDTGLPVSREEKNKQLQWGQGESEGMNERIREMGEKKKQGKSRR